ncbi:hypothetical protein AX16_007851 [Volvariella volvacea WC 439]|nr:hypothetical protein AX16_007851 [Volvariella volvacea WC 439]
MTGGDTHEPLSPSYLASPLETLLESWEDVFSEWITLHDISEAYNFLCNKFQLRAEFLLREHPRSSALEYIRLNANKLCSIICRDISRALIDVNGNINQSLESDFGLSVTSLSDDEFHHATSLSTLSHNALRFISTICTFPALYSLFSDHELNTILDELFRVVANKALPTPNAPKTYTLVIHILSTHRLPPSIIRPKYPEVISALDRAAKGDFGARAAAEGLQAIRRYLQEYPVLFIEPISISLSSLLSTHIISNDHSARLHASHVLNRLAQMKVSAYMDLKFPHDTLSTTIKHFVSKSGSKTAAEANPELPSLYSTLMDAAQDDSGSSLRPGTVWGLVVIASFLILAGDSIFSQPATLRLFERFMSLASVSKKASTRAVFSATWRCLVWCYADLCRKSRRDQKYFQIKQKAFSFLRDAGLKHIEAISTALLIVVLNDARYVPHTQKREELATGISVLKDLACSAKPETRNPAADVLEILLGSKVAQSGYNDGILIDKRMLDGSILNASLDTLPKATKGLVAQQASYTNTLSEEDVQQHWDALVETWKCCTSHPDQKVLHITPQLLRIWRHLLLAQVQLTLDSSQNNGPSSVARRISNVICSFLTPAVTPPNQASQLNLVLSLWKELKQVFCASPNWLSGPAQIIIAAILKYQFEIRDEGVRREWTSLCAELIETGIPALMHILASKGEGGNSTRDGGIENNDEVKQLLWSLLAKTYGDRGNGEGLRWEDLVSFLILPFGAWKMSDEGYELWEATLRNAFYIAALHNIKPLTVIDHLVQHLGESRIKLLSASPMYLLKILPYVSLSSVGAAHNLRFPDDLFAVFNDILLAQYPLTPEGLSDVLNIFHCLNTIIETINAEQVLYFIRAMKNSLRAWLIDEQAVLTDDTLNMITESVYIPLLDLLRAFYHRYIIPCLPSTSTSTSTSTGAFTLDSPPSPALQTLHLVCELLTAPFARILQPATGPMAFIELWKDTFGNPRYPWLDSETAKALPSEIKNCLRACEYAWKVDLGLPSSVLDSQDSVRASVPDSQSFAQHQASARQSADQAFRSGSLNESWRLGMAQNVDAQMEHESQPECLPDEGEGIIDVDPPPILLPPPLIQAPPPGTRHSRSPESSQEVLQSPLAQKVSFKKLGSKIASRLKPKPKPRSRPKKKTVPAAPLMRRVNLASGSVGDSALAALQEYSSQVPDSEDRLLSDEY